MAVLDLPSVYHLRFRPEKAYAALRQMLHWAQQDGRRPVDLRTLLTHVRGKPRCSRRGRIARTARLHNLRRSRTKSIIKP